MDYTNSAIPVKESHTGRAILGFILSIVLFISLILTGILGSLKLSVIKGNNLNDFFDNCNFYDIVKEVAIAGLAEQSSDLGLSEDALNTIFSADIIQNTSEKIIDCISTGEDFDISDLKDDCISTVEDTSNILIDEVFEELENTSATLDYETLSNNSLISEYSQNYNVDIAQEIVDELNNTYGNTSISIEDIDTEEAREKISGTVSTKIIPMVDSAFDKYADKVNDVVNEAFDKINEQSGTEKFFYDTESFMKMFSFATMLTILISLVFIILQFIVYCKSLNRAFRNIGICGVLAGVFTLIEWGLISYVTDIIMKEEFSSFNSIESVIKDYIEQLLSNISGKFMMLGIIFMVAGILSIIVSAIVKSRKSAIC